VYDVRLNPRGQSFTAPDAALELEEKEMARMLSSGRRHRKAMRQRKILLQIRNTFLLFVWAGKPVSS
jgi:hypothetical protein